MKKGIKYLLLGVMALLPLSAKAADMCYTTVDLDCPTWVNPGETVSCKFKLDKPCGSDSDRIVINGISAKYSIGEGLVYNSFNPIQEFNVNSNTENGFAVGNTSAVFTSEDIATIKLDIPANATKDSTYTFGMYDFSMTDMEFNDLYPNDDETFEISRTFKIIDLSFNSDLNVDEETNVIKLNPGASASDLVSNITTNGEGTLTEQVYEYAGAAIPFEAITEGSENDISLKTGMEIVVNYYNDNEQICEENESGMGCAFVTDKQYIYPIAVKGDVTGDGNIRMSDVMKAATHLIEGDVLVGKAYIAAGDVTGDGEIMMSDVMKLANHIIVGGEL